jgi:hypothetical protein
LSLQSEAGNFQRLKEAISSPSSVATPYWLAVGAVAALFLVRIGLGPWLHPHGAFLHQSPDRRSLSRQSDDENAGEEPLHHPHEARGSHGGLIGPQEFQALPSKLF